MFVVGLAVLTFLAEVVAEQPLVCVVDDAQWLDSASIRTLSILARRLRVDPVAMIFAIRDGQNRDMAGLVRLPGLALTGLADRDARALLAATVPGPMDERVRERILAQARGNPLALRELPRSANAPTFAGIRSRRVRSANPSARTRRKAGSTDTRAAKLRSMRRDIGRSSPTDPNGNAGVTKQPTS
ncbi:hypothetical protein AB0F91_41730 [Amycolatopsis sp. NPDC023774]|uniref:hypothetical protein n=1 Tax=Amycolatopsis sp. NPDC023774 TaxID=3155015 RepID=UPI0033FB0496